MRVVDVNEYYSPTGGGVRTYLDRKMGIMADLGHELIVLAPGDRTWREERPGGGAIYWLKSPSLIVDRNYRIFVDEIGIQRILDELAPDVVENSCAHMSAWSVGNWQGDAVKVFFAHNDHVSAYPQRWLDGWSTPEQV